jgi:hypothetical protein
MAARTTPEPALLLSRLVLAALILTAGVVLSRRFLSPPTPRPQAGGLKPLAIPLWQSAALASGTALEDDAPDPGAGPAARVSATAGIWTSGPFFPAPAGGRSGASSGCEPARTWTTR